MGGSPDPEETTMTNETTQATTQQKGSQAVPGAVSTKAAGCCGPVEQESCCAPAAKSSCCGTTGGQGCGCR
jgi:hypothetical protein